MHPLLLRCCLFLAILFISLTLPAQDSWQKETRYRKVSSLQQEGIDTVLYFYRHRYGFAPSFNDTGVFITAGVPGYLVWVKHGVAWVQKTLDVFDRRRYDLVTAYSLPVRLHNLAFLQLIGIYDLMNLQVRLGDYIVEDSTDSGNYYRPFLVTSHPLRTDIDLYVGHQTRFISFVNYDFDSCVVYQQFDSASGREKEYSCCCNLNYPHNIRSGWKQFYDTAMAAFMAIDKNGSLSVMVPERKRGNSAARNETGDSTRGW